MAQVLSAPRGTLPFTAAGAFCPHQARDTPNSSHDTYRPWDGSHRSPGRCSLQGQRYPLHSARRAGWGSRATSGPDAALPCKCPKAACLFDSVLAARTGFLGSGPSHWRFLPLRAHVREWHRGKHERERKRKSERSEKRKTAGQQKNQREHKPSPSCRDQLKMTT